MRVCKNLAPDWQGDARVEGLKTRGIITLIKDGVKENPSLAWDLGEWLQNSAHWSGYADLTWAGGLTNRISMTSRPAPATIALSATLKAGHWYWPM